jgi:hypothetical protein
MTSATKFEREVLDIVLLELRRAMRMRGQLTITIDPFVHGGGAHVFASPNTNGRSYTIERNGT